MSGRVTPSRSSAGRRVAVGAVVLCISVVAFLFWQVFERSNERERLRDILRQFDIELHDCATFDVRVLERPFFHRLWWDEPVTVEIDSLRTRLTSEAEKALEWAVDVFEIRGFVFDGFFVSEDGRIAPGGDGYSPVIRPLTAAPMLAEVQVACQNIKIVADVLEVFSQAPVPTHVVVFAVTPEQVLESDRLRKFAQQAPSLESFVVDDMELIDRLR